MGSRSGFLGARYLAESGDDDQNGHVFDNTIMDLNKEKLPMSEANKKLVRRYYELVSGDLAGIDEVVSADFVDHHFPPDTPPGPQGVRQFFTKIIPSFFSDLKIDIDFFLAEGDRVDCHFVAWFKHTGEYARIAPKGKQIRLPAISTFRIAGGKLVEAWEIYDSGDMVRQMQA